MTLLWKLKWFFLTASQATISLLCEVYLPVSLAEKKLVKFDIMNIAGRGGGEGGEHT